MILETEILCEEGRNDGLGIEGKEIWLPCIIDLRTAKFVKLTSPDPDDEVHFNRATIDFGDEQVIANESYKHVAGLFKQAKIK